MLNKKILLLYSFSRQDERLLTYLLEHYRSWKSVRITLLHVYAPLHKYTQMGTGATEGTSFQGHWQKQKTGSRINELRKKEEELQRVSSYLVEEGFLPEQIEARFSAKEKSVAQDVVDIVRKEEFSTVLLSYDSFKAKYFISERIENKLLNNIKNREIVLLT